MRLTCDCGKNLRVDEALAGRHFKCPGCGQRIAVPKRSKGASASPPPVVSKGATGDDRRHTGDRAQPPLPAANTRTSEPSSRWYLWLLGGGGWLVVGVIVVVLVFSNRNGASTVPQPPSQPAVTIAATSPPPVVSKTETVPAQSGDRSDSIQQKTQAPVTRHLQPPLLPDLVTNSIGMKLKLIPAGEFLMGSPPNEPDRRDHEGPQHKVRITKPFYAGVYEVTQAEYKAVMGTNPSHFSPSGAGSAKIGGQNTDRFPVENVSWYDAAEFCNKLSVGDGLSPYYSLTSIEREEGSIKSATVTSANAGRKFPDSSGYRLPTEAEWEYMYRGNTQTPYWFGSVLNGDKANVNGDYPFGTTSKGTFLGRPATAGSYAANPFGLYETHGNVFEWCEDVYDESVYGSRSGTTADPVSSSGSNSRMLRGGPWSGSAYLARSAYRGGFKPGDRWDLIGFRVVR